MVTSFLGCVASGVHICFDRHRFVLAPRPLSLLAFARKNHDSQCEYDFASPTPGDNPGNASRPSRLSHTFFEHWVLQSQIRSSNKHPSQKPDWSSNNHQTDPKAGLTQVADPSTPKRIPAMDLRDLHQTLIPEQPADLRFPVTRGRSHDALARSLAPGGSTGYNCPAEASSVNGILGAYACMVPAPAKVDSESPSRPGLCFFLWGEELTSPEFMEFTNTFFWGLGHLSGT